MFFVGPAVWAQGLGAEIGRALENGEFGLGLRYRYEFVDDEGFRRNANASTLATRLTYTSAPVRQFSVTVNLDDSRPIGADRYDSTRNGRTLYPVVPEPAGTEVNLASLAYTGLADTTLVVGRQRLLRANGRFVGNTPWRQNETTYDAASVTHVVNDELTVFYSYVDRVNRTFGPDPGLPSNTFGGPIHLLDTTYSPGRLLNFTAYGYWLDLSDAPEAASLSTRTFGTRVDGAYALGDRWSLTYAAEYAYQADTGDNPNDYDTSFYELNVGLRREGLNLRVAYERHGGSRGPGEPLQAPIGRVHLFRGWADKFVLNPPEGLVDVYVAADVDLWSWQLSAAYHDFSAETGGGDYGNELDIGASWRFEDRYELWLGWAHYDAHGFSADTNKLWFMLSASFRRPGARP